MQPNATLALKANILQMKAPPDAMFVIQENIQLTTLHVTSAIKEIIVTKVSYNGYTPYVFFTLF